jgi:hypothetical protein
MSAKENLYLNISTPFVQALVDVGGIAEAARWPRFHSKGEAVTPESRRVA